MSKMGANPQVRGRGREDLVFISGENVEAIALLRAFGAAQRPSIADRSMAYHPSRAAAKDGGASRDRTGDLKLAKLALSQLSYGPVTIVKLTKFTVPFAPEWWAEEELNLRPHAYQACALTT